MNNLLEKNNEQMATQVETFVIEETAELIYDGEALDNWNELVSELGLKGQTEIVKPEKSPIPFLHLKKGFVNVLKTLCPRVYDIETFNVTPIPLEILKLVSLSKKDSHFNKIEVWYDDKNPDPCVVGITGYFFQSAWGSDRNKDLDGQRFSSEKEAKDAGATGTIYFSDQEHYLIGKWGDVKHSFEELKEKATKRYIEEEGANYRKQIKDLQRKLDDVESDAVQRFS